VSTICLGINFIFFTPIFTALICTLSQVTLFKVLNSRRRIREREGLTTDGVASATAGSKAVSATGMTATPASR
jgi:hypothetical protein